MATLLVWDFDWSLINENTDTFVVQQLDPSGDVWRRGKQKMQQGVGWTELMDWAVGVLIRPATPRGRKRCSAALGRSPRRRAASAGRHQRGDAGMPRPSAQGRADPRMHGDQ